MSDPTPTISRSIIIPYEVYLKISKYAAANNMRVNAAINRALAWFVREVVEKEPVKEDN